MTIHVWWLFAATVFLLSATPGPNMLHALTRSVHLGFRRAAPAFAGCLSAVFCVLVLSAAGVGTLLAALPRLFDVIRYAGAGYLLWLGVRAWMAPVHDEGEAAVVGSRMTGWGVYRGGFLTGISNPKLLLFAAAFFPQFIDRHAAVAGQFAILIATFVGIESFWLLLYGLGGRKLARLIGTPRMKRLFNRVTGTVFLGFGAVLLRGRS
ncbi:LysE family translocator [Acidomonas methanolica]|uniref:LysE family translocator n=1 Tax=Acidomonas methanolica TaxID=437 RepID=UPI002119FCB9|nr:LysE family translocator [Acidomonas methanolica]